MTQHSLYWCPSCGMVWADYAPKLCWHSVPPSAAHPPRRMERLPSWHPYAKPLDEQAAA